LVATNPTRVRFPSHKNGGLQAVNELIKYKTGYIINSIATWPEIEGKAFIRLFNVLDGLPFNNDYLLLS
jgi:hypothetical protein